jgi:hypothetical protein
MCTICAFSNLQIIACLSLDLEGVSNGVILESHTNCLTILNMLLSSPYIMCSEPLCS